MPEDYEFDDFDDFDDQLLLAAVEQAEMKQQKIVQKPAVKQKTMADFGFAKRIEPTPAVQVEGRASNPTRMAAIESYHRVDEEALKTWIYPINYPLREYQFNIAQSSLFSNTLVCLPTGLGKTFIAAVVMYNYFKWFPEGKIVFMAPTKPLVNQQIDACYKITGISSESCCEMTGNVKSELRSKYWSSKRMFFMTPETFRNDLQNGTCDALKVVLVVFDEAHRASGRYAYCDIIKELEREQAVFRVMALSATPGSEAKKVQAVIQNLLIEKLQMRTEESMDVQKNIFKRTVEEVLIKPTPLLQEIIDIFIKFPEKILQRLVQNKIYREPNPLKANVYGLVIAGAHFRTNKHLYAKSRHGMISGDLYTAQQLLRSLETLTGCGMKAFYQEMFAIAQEVKQSTTPSITKRDMVSSIEFKKMMEKLEEEMKKPEFSSHPKMDKLSDLVVEHFKNHTGNGETRVMIFSTLRSTVEEIVELLKLQAPLVRPTLFVGQAKGTKNSAGMKQKDQLRVISEFHAGVHNVIVATCIGEEGLDIGDLDLIICFDNQKSPIRMLQRCGRTGRKRQGKICLLINEGKEEEAVKSARRSYKNVQNSIIDGKRLDMYNGELAGVIPDGCKPECSKLELVIAKVEEKVVKMKKSDSAGSAYLNEQQENDYIRRYMSEVIPCEKLQFNNQLLWQTSELPVIEMPRSEKSKAFVSLMEYFEEIKSTEAPPQFSNSLLKSSQSQRPVATKPEVKKRFIATLAHSSPLSSEIEIPSYLSKPKDVDKESQDLSFLDNDDPILEPKKSNWFELSAPDHEQNLGEISDFESVDLQPGAISMDIAVKDSGSSPVKEIIVAKESDTVIANVPDAADPNDTFVFSDFEFDENDLQQIENQFFKPEQPVTIPTPKPVQPLTIPTTPDVSNLIDQSVIIHQRRAKNNIVLSSTPHTSKHTPLVIRTSAVSVNADPISSSEEETEPIGLRKILLDKRKRAPRQAPKPREFKIPFNQSHSSKKPKPTNPKRRRKNIKAFEMGLIDDLVDVASDDTGTSEEFTGSEYDSDLSGFIANTPVPGTPGFYRTDLAKNGRDNLYPTRTRPVFTPYKGRYNQSLVTEESQGSLGDFVNDEIIYSDKSGLLPEDQNTQDFEDSLQRSEIPLKSSPGKKELEDMEIEDLFDF